MHVPNTQCVSTTVVPRKIESDSIFLGGTNILEGGPSLKQHLMFSGRRVSCRHYFCLCTLITIIDGQ